MRIAHWFPNFLDGGGVANSVFGLARAQAEAGADVTIVSRRSERSIYGALPASDGLGVVSWEAGPALPLAGLKLHIMRPGASRSLRQQSPEIVHAHGEFNPDNWWVPRLWNVPAVLTPHGAFHPSVMGRGATAKRFYVAVAKRLLYSRVAQIHVLNPAEGRDVAAVLPSVSKYQVRQGPSPWVQPVSTPSEEKAAGPLRLMYVGRLAVAPKGLDVLLEAVAAVAEKKRSAPVELHLVGPDWDGGAEEIEARSQRLGIRDIVKIHGRVPAAEIPALLASCDVYVQMSRNEGSPMSLNDALALGKPIIASNRIGTVSDPDIAGLPHVRSVEPEPASAAAAIAGVIDELPALRSEVRRSQAAMAGVLSWEAAAAQHLHHYASIVESSKASG